MDQAEYATLGLTQGPMAVRWRRTAPHFLLKHFDIPQAQFYEVEKQMGDV